MEINRLAAKQKRYQDWLRFTQTEVDDPALREAILTKLHAYRLKLNEVWNSGTPEETHIQALEDMERCLEQLNNESRLRGASS